MSRHDLVDAYVAGKEDDNTLEQMLRCCVERRAVAMNNTVFVFPIRDLCNIFSVEDGCGFKEVSALMWFGERLEWFCKSIQR